MERCLACGVVMVDGVLPLTRAALEKNMCGLCFLRNRATTPYALVNEADDGDSEISYFGGGADAMALVGYRDTDVAHLADIAPENTGHTAR